MARPTQNAAENPAANPDTNATPNAEGDPISALFSMIDGAKGHATTALVHRDEAGEWALLTRCAVSAFDPIAIGETYGPGRYMVRLLDGQRRYVAQRSWTYAGPKKNSPAPAVEPATNPADSAGKLDMGALIVAMMQQQAQASAQTMQVFGSLMTALVSRPQQSDTLTARDLIALLKPNTEKTPVAELIAALRELEELRGERPPAEGGADELSAKDLIPLLGTLLAGGKSATPRPPIPQASPLQGRSAPAKTPAQIGHLEPPPASAAPAPEPIVIGRDGRPEPARTIDLGHLRDIIAEEEIGADVLDALEGIVPLLVLGARSPDPEPAAYAVIIEDKFAAVGIDAAEVILKRTAALPDEERAQVAAKLLAAIYPSLGYEDTQRFVIDVIECLLDREDDDEAAPEPDAPEPAAPLATPPVPLTPGAELARTQRGRGRGRGPKPAEPAAMPHPKDEHPTQ